MALGMLLNLSVSELRILENGDGKSMHLVGSWKDTVSSVGPCVAGEGPCCETMHVMTQAREYGS